MLDIIIPSYKDMNGLYRTLKSVYYPQYKDWITITVIDDCSNEDYSEIMSDYPSVHFYFLKENHGPGSVRQYGIDHTKEPYIFFIDCGDIILSKYSFMEIKDEIEAHPNYYLLFWCWINEHKKISDIHYRSTQGWVYKRELLNKYNIRFCENGVGCRADEDVGFNHMCTTIIKHLEVRDNKQYSAFMPVPIYQKVFYEKSITNSDNFNLTKHIPGLAMNATHCIDTLAKTDIDIDILLDELNALLFSLYKAFLNYMTQDKELLDTHWETIRRFYLNVYKQYEGFSANENYLTQNTRRFLDTLKKIIPNPNIKRFIQELNENEFCPTRYFNI